MPHADKIKAIDLVLSTEGRQHFRDRIRESSRHSRIADLPKLAWNLAAL